MKRFHIHVRVTDLQASIGFYSKLFGAAPARVEGDYAKWMLEDPRINFAISSRGGEPGVDHLGFQTDTAEELGELKARAAAAEMAMLDEGETTCCYARSEKYWVTDPQGVAWEHYHTLGNVPLFSMKEEATQAGACCAPAAPSPAPTASAEPAAAVSCCGPVHSGAKSSCC
jgi:catechol 2,3-dioxygenase-like lactoylglutathione lyase family enzyme